MHFGYWIRNPRRIWSRLRYWWWEKQNPDKPWLTPGAVDFLEIALTREMSGLEFGSGRSTAWYAGKLGRLLSVEHEPVWHSRVKRELARLNCTNVDYRLIPLDHPVSAPEQVTYDPVPAYVALAAELQDESLDLVVVDGHYRSHCIAAVVAKLKPGGLLLVDDANMWTGNMPPVPEGWPEASRTGNGIKFTVVWRKPRKLDAPRDSS